MHGKNIVRFIFSWLYIFRPLPPTLDYLPVDIHRTVVGHIHARVVSRALEVRFHSSRLNRVFTS